MSRAVSASLATQHNAAYPNTGSEEARNVPDADWVLPVVRFCVRRKFKTAKESDAASLTMSRPTFNLDNGLKIGVKDMHPTATSTSPVQWHYDCSVQG